MIPNKAEGSIETENSGLRRTLIEKVPGRAIGIHAYHTVQECLLRDYSLNLRRRPIQNA